MNRDALWRFNQMAYSPLWSGQVFKFNTKVKRKFTSGPSNGSTSTGCQLTFWKMYDVCLCTMLLCNFDNFCFSRKQKGTYGFSRRSQIIDSQIKYFLTRPIPYTFDGEYFRLIIDGLKNYKNTDGYMYLSLNYDPPRFITYCYTCLSHDYTRTRTL